MRRKGAKRLQFWKREFKANWFKAILKGFCQVFESIFINFPVRVFWKMSDYGSRTLPIALSFILLNIIFTAVYTLLIPAVTSIGGAEPVMLLGVTDPVTGFMQTTMMIFSITDMATWDLGFFPMLCVLIHVVLGYFILAALVTRFAVMFQTRSQ